MSSEWRQVRLGDLIDLKGGLAYKGDLITNQGTPMVTMGCVDPSRRFKIEGLKFYSGEFKETHTAIAGDIVIATRDVTQDRIVIGCPCLLPKLSEHDRYVVATNTYRLINQSDIANKFLYLVLKSKSYRNQIIASAKGSTVVMITKDSILDYSFSLPPKDERDSIVHILGTLDDKIELNRKTNETLEGIAKALFRSWFVDFDPVKAKAEGRPTGLPDEISELFPDSFEESELGEIPSGWSVTEISTLCQFISSGGTPSRKNPVFWTNGSIKWFKTGELGDSFVIDSEEHITQEGLNGSSCKLFDDGDILFALYGATVGKIGIVTSPSTSNQAAACLRPLEEVGTPFLECLLYATRERLMNIATGAAQQNLYLGMVKEHLIVSPSGSLPSAFSNLVSPISHRRLHYLQEAKTLTCLRDALLPRLISGELRVPDAEKMLEEAGV